MQRCLLCPPGNAGLAATTVRTIDLPPGWVEITDWREALEVFRSPKVGANRSSADDERFRAGTAIRIDGVEHRDRRRAMNQLLKRNGHAWFREQALHPAVGRNLEALLRSRDVDGIVRADLVPFGFRLHVQMAATLAGIDGIDTEEAADELLAISSAVGTAAAQTNVEALYVDVTPEDAVLGAGLAAMADYEERFFRPSLERRRHLLADVDAGRLAEDDLPKDLLTLVAGLVDPRWSDEGLAIRETLLVMRATVGSSTQAMLRVIDEVWRWLDEHPGDRRHLSDDVFLMGAVNDALRLYPSQPGFARYALEDLTLSTGREIKKGEHLVIRAGIAARDASVFGPDAERFNPRRPTAPGAYAFGLSFASGPHMCFGLPLVMGAEGIDGSLFYTLKQLYAAGMRPDPARRSTRVKGIAAFRFASYPAIFAG
jgi:cytochrome P450